MPILIFAISIVASFMIAWKAVEWLKPYHAGKAALFAMAVALAGPECITFVVALLRDSADAALPADQQLNDALIKVAGGKMTCALLAVLAWCGGEALAGTKQRRLRLATAPVTPTQLADTSKFRNRISPPTPRAPARVSPSPASGTSRTQL
jgi:hypothetical protein